MTGISDLDNAIYFMAILNLVIVVVFFVMASNINKIKHNSNYIAYMLSKQDKETRRDMYNRAKDGVEGLIDSEESL